MNTRIILGTVAAAAVLLAGCGGGGGGGSTPTPTPAAVQISGTAATGAPFDGANVTIVDSTGAEVGTGTTGADGSYTITLTTGAKPPFVIKAQRDDLTLVSVAPDTTSTNVNITPITNLIAARLSASGDPAKLADEVKNNPDLVTSTTVNAKVEEIVAALKPVLDAVGANINPLTGTFKADGTGLDRALDSLQIVITPDSPNTSRIEVVVKQAVDETAGEMPAIAFTAGANADAKPPVLPTIDSSKLVDNGVAPLIADLLNRITACHKLPTAERTSKPNDSSATGADVTATACKTLFKDDDPADYLNSGRRVGGNANLNDWFGIFIDGATDTVYDRGVYQFSRSNGDIVATFRITTKDGIPQQRAMVATKVTVAGKEQLRLTGNRYVLPGSVEAYHQVRTYLNNPQASYYSTGYSFSVPNWRRSDGSAVFEKVVVTSQREGALPITLEPSSAGSALLSIKGYPGNSFLRLGRAYLDSSNTSDPKAMDTARPFSTARWTDEQLAAIPQHSLWKFEYHVTANGENPATVVTQYFRTFARAMTIAEFKQKPLAKLTDSEIVDIKSLSASAGYIPMAGQRFIAFDWEVPAGAVAPTNLTGFGSGPGSSGRVSFDDSMDVKPTARTVQIPCTRQPGGVDQHCSEDGAYAAGSVLALIHLRGKDELGRELVHFYDFSLPSAP